jgi:hypothetical protein
MLRWGVVFPGEYPDQGEILIIKTKRKGEAMVKTLSVRNLFILLTGMVLATFLCAAPAFSEQDKLACGDEIEKYCSNIRPGQLSITVCLDTNREQLSAECRKKVDRSMAKILQAKQICEADIEKFCPGVQPGEGRILNCMTANKRLLTPDCRQQVDKYSATSRVPEQNITPVK